MSYVPGDPDRRYIPSNPDEENYSQNLYRSLRLTIQRALQREKEVRAIDARVSDLESAPTITRHDVRDIVEEIVPETDQGSSQLDELRRRVAYLEGQGPREDVPGHDHDELYYRKAEVQDLIDGTSPESFLTKEGNLEGIGDPALARTNLGVLSVEAVEDRIEAAVVDTASDVDVTWQDSGEPTDVETYLHWLHQNVSTSGGDTYIPTWSEIPGKPSLRLEGEGGITVSPSGPQSLDHSIVWTIGFSGETGGGVPETRTITAGNGLIGGGALSSNLSLGANFGSSSTQVARGSTPITIDAGQGLTGGGSVKVGEGGTISLATDQPLGPDDTPIFAALGLNVTSPAYTADIKGSLRAYSSEKALLFDGDDLYLDRRASTEGAFPSFALRHHDGTGTTDYLRLSGATNTNFALTLKNALEIDGQVGIGMSPTRALDVDGDIGATGAVGAQDLTFTRRILSGAAQIHYDDAWHFVGGDESVGANGNAALRAGSLGLERLPDRTLDVQGTARFSGLVEALGGIAMSGLDLTDGDHTHTVLSGYGYSDAEVGMSLGGGGQVIIGAGPSRALIEEDEAAATLDDLWLTASDSVEIRTNVSSEVDGYSASNYSFGTDGTLSLDSLRASGSIGSPSFLPGFTGSGWQIHQENVGYHATFDALTVRGAFNVYELITNRIRAVGGSFWATDRGKTKRIVNTGEVDGKTIYFIELEKTSEFVEGDLILAQVEGVRSKLRVVETGATDPDTQESDLAYIRASFEGGSAPEEGQTFVRVGNDINTSRQGSVYLTSSEPGAPYLDVLDGVDSFSALSTTDKVKARLGSIGNISLGDVTVPADTYGLVSDSVYLKGTILADEGYIGGWSLSGGDLTAGDITLETGTSSRIFVSGAESPDYNQSDTPVFFDDQGRFSLGDKLTWDGSTLSVTGTIVAGSGSNVTTDAEFGTLESRVTDIEEGGTGAVTGNQYRITGVAGTIEPSSSNTLSWSDVVVHMANGDTYAVANDSSTLSSGRNYLYIDTTETPADGQITLQVTTSPANIDVRSVLVAVSETATSPQLASVQIVGGKTFISGDWINTGAVTAASISAGAVTSAKIATDALQSRNWSADAGSYFNLAQGNIQLGGSSAPKFSFDNATGTLALSGQITIESGSSGISGFSDAGDLATGDDLDDVADGATHKRTTEDEKTGAARAYSSINSDNALVTKVLPGSAVGTPAEEGLFLGSDYLGYHDGTNWKVFIDDAGQFTFKGSDSRYISWDGAELTVRGRLLVENGNTAAGTDYVDEEINALNTTLSDAITDAQSDAISHGESRRVVAVEGTFESTGPTALSWENVVVRTADGTEHAAADGSGSISGQSYLYVDLTDEVTGGTIPMHVATSRSSLTGSRLLVAIAEQGSTKVAVRIVAGKTLIDGDWIHTGAITTSTLSASAVTTEKLATDAIKSNNWGTDAGSFFNLSGGSLQLGGSDNPALYFDGTDLSLSGSITASSGEVGSWTIEAGSLTRTDAEDNTLIALDATNQRIAINNDSMLFGYGIDSTGTKHGLQIDENDYWYHDGTFSLAGSKFQWDANDLALGGTVSADFFSYKRVKIDASNASEFYTYKLASDQLTYTVLDLTGTPATFVRIEERPDYPILYVRMPGYGSVYLESVLNAVYLARKDDAGSIASESSKDQIHTDTDDWAYDLFIDDIQRGGNTYANVYELNAGARITLNRSEDVKISAASSYDNFRVNGRLRVGERAGNYTSAGQIRYTGGRFQGYDGDGWVYLDAGTAEHSGAIEWDDVTGKPETATRWAYWSDLQSHPSLQLTGAVTGSASLSSTGTINLATTVNHNHDSDYVDIGGDTMTGDLTVPNLFAKNVHVGTGGQLYVSAISGSGKAKAYYNGGSSELRFYPVNADDETISTSFSLSLYYNGIYESVWHSGNDGYNSDLTAGDSGKLGNYDSIDYPRKAEDATIEGTWTFEDTTTFAKDLEDGDTLIVLDAHRPYAIRRYGAGAASADLSFETDTGGNGFAFRSTASDHDLLIIDEDGDVHIPSGPLTLGTQASSASHAVRADRSITGTGTLGFDIEDGGDLTSDRTLKVVPPQNLQTAAVPTFGGLNISSYTEIRQESGLVDGTDTYIRNTQGNNHTEIRLQDSNGDNSGIRVRHSTNSSDTWSDVFLATNSDIEHNGHPLAHLDLDETVTGEWTHTDNVFIKREHNVSWSRGYRFTDTDDTVTQQYGTFMGASDGFIYGFIGESYSDTIVRFYPDKTVRFANSVQIGSNSTPSYTLDVDGQGRFSGDLRIEGGSIGLSANDLEVIKYSDSNSDTRSGYWSSKDTLYVQGDSNSVNNVVLRTGYLNLTQHAWIEGKLGVKNLVESDGYVSGAFGTGWRIDSSLSNGRSYMEIDDLRVRGELRSHVFRYDEVRAVDGFLYLSSSTTLTEDDTLSGVTQYIRVKNPSFVTGDLVLIRARDGSGDIYEFRGEVTGGPSTETANAGSSTQTVYRYTISFDSAYAGMTIQGGDTIVRVGSSDAARQGSLYFDANSEYAPFFDVYDGVDSWSTFHDPSKVKVRMGNLHGLTGYDQDTYGFFAGDLNAAHITADDIYGLRIMQDSEEMIALRPDGSAMIGKDVSIGGRSLSIDSFEKRPLALWQFEGTLTSAVGGIAPTGQSGSTETSYGLVTGTNLVTTKRPGEGVFGGDAIAVEEGTTNLWKDRSNPNRDWARNSTSGWWSYVGDYGIDVDFTIAEADHNESLLFYPNLGSTHTIENASYTLSFEYEVLEFDLSAGNDFSVYLADSNDSWFTSTDLELKPGDKGRVVITGTNPTGSTSINRIAFHWGGSLHTGDTVRMKIRNIQLEQKPFATSFTEEDRSGGNLRYDNVLDNWSSFTFGAWVRQVDDKASTATEPSIEIATVPGVWAFSTGYGRPEFGHYDSAGTYHNVHGGEIAPTREQAKEWNFWAVAVDFGEGVVRFAVGDTIREVALSDTNLTDTTNYLRLAYNVFHDNTYSTSSSILIDEVTLLPYGASESELLRMANADAPLQLSAQTSYLDGSKLVTGRIHDQLGNVEINLNDGYFNFHDKLTWNSSESRLDVEGHITATSGKIGTGTYIGDGVINRVDTQGIHIGDFLADGGMPMIRIVDDSTNFINFFYDTVTGGEWGLMGQKDGEYVFQLGSTNQMAGWSFDQSKIYGDKSRATGSSSEGAYLYISNETEADNGGDNGTSMFYAGRELEGFGLAWHRPGNAGHLILGQIASAEDEIKDGYYGLQMMGHQGDGREYFALAADTATDSADVYNRIAGWSFDHESFSKESITLASSNVLDYDTPGSLVLGDNDGAPLLRLTGDVAVQDYVQMWYNGTNSWGFIGKEGGQDVFRLGDSNTIAGWDFTHQALSRDDSSTRLAISTDITSAATQSRGEGFYLYRYNAISVSGDTRFVGIGRLHDKDSWDFSDEYGFEILTQASGSSADVEHVFRAGPGGAYMAGWKLDATAIYSGSKGEDATFSDGLTLGSDGWLSSKQFYIDTDGTAKFKGELSAASGSFAGSVKLGEDLDNPNVIIEPNDTEVSASTGTLVDSASSIGHDVDPSVQSGHIIRALSDYNAWTPSYTQSLTLEADTLHEIEVDVTRHNNSTTTAPLAVVVYEGETMLGWTSAYETTTASFTFNTNNPSSASDYTIQIGFLGPDDDQASTGVWTINSYTVTSYEAFTHIGLGGIATRFSPSSYFQARRGLVSVGGRFAVDGSVQIEGDLTVTGTTYQVQPQLVKGDMTLQSGSSLFVGDEEVITNSGSTNNPQIDWDYISGAPSFSLSSHNHDNRYLRSNGDEMEGTLSFNDARFDSDAILITAANENFNVWNIAQGSFGWRLYYNGAATSNNNSLELYSEDGGRVYEILQNGTFNYEGAAFNINGDVVATQSWASDHYLRSDADSTLAGRILVGGGDKSSGLYFGGYSGGTHAYVRQAANGQIDIGSDNLIKFFETDAGSAVGEISTNNSTIDMHGGYLVSGTTVVDSSGQIDWDRIKNEPSFVLAGGDTMTGALKVSADIVTTEHLVLAHTTTSAERWRMWYDGGTGRMEIQSFGDRDADGTEEWTSRLTLPNRNSDTSDLLVNGTHKIWHEGNDGYNSGLIAEDSGKLDGHSSGYFAARGENETIGGEWTYTASIPMELEETVSGFVYQPQEGGAYANRRYFLMFNYTDDGSYPYLTNRTPSGDVAIFTGTSAGGGENERFRIKGGNGTVNAFFKDVNLGIGTNSPGAKTVITDVVSGTFNALTLRNGSYSGGEVTRFQMLNTNTDTGTGRGMAIDVKRVGGGADVTFKVGDGSGGTTDMLYLDGINDQVDFIGDLKVHKSGGAQITVQSDNGNSTDDYPATLYLKEDEQYDHGFKFRYHGSANYGSILTTQGGSDHEAMRFTRNTGAIDVKSSLSINGDTVYASGDNVSYGTITTSGTIRGVVTIERNAGDADININDGNPTWYGDSYGNTITFKGDNSTARSYLVAGGLNLSRTLAASTIIANTSVGSTNSDIYDSGFSGRGGNWKIDSNNRAVFDNLMVRDTMRIYELEINKISAINGSQWISNSVKAEYRGSGVFEVDMESVNAIPFEPGDLIQFRQWDKDGTHNSGSSPGYHTDNLTVESVDQAAGTVTMTTSAQGGTGFIADLVRVGSSNASRQGSIYMTADDTDAPYIDVLDGVDSHSWGSDEIKVRLGRLDGITDSDAGLDGNQSNLYGLYADNVYLKGHIHATSGSFSGELDAATGSFSSSVGTDTLSIAGGELKFANSFGDRVRIGSNIADEYNGIWMDGHLVMDNGVIHIKDRSNGYDDTWININHDNYRLQSGEDKALATLGESTGGGSLFLHDTDEDPYEWDSGGVTLQGHDNDLYVNTDKVLTEDNGLEYNLKSSTVGTINGYVSVTLPDGTQAFLATVNPQ